MWHRSTKRCNPVLSLLYQDIFIVEVLYPKGKQSIVLPTSNCKNFPKDVRFIEQSACGGTGKRIRLTCSQTRNQLEWPLGRVLGGVSKREKKPLSSSRSWPHISVKVRIFSVPLSHSLNLFTTNKSSAWRSGFSEIHLQIFEQAFEIAPVEV